MNKAVLVGIVVVVLLGLVGGGAWFMNRSSSGITPNVSVPQTVLPTTPVATDTQSVSSGSIKEFTIEGSGFKFTPVIMSVKMGDTVRITFKNTQGIHDLVIDEFDVATNQIGIGEEEEVEFVADKVGTFEFYCSVANHRAQGMKGTLVVE